MGSFFPEWATYGHQMECSLVFFLAATIDFCLTGFVLSPQIYGQAAIGSADTSRPLACEVACSDPPRAVALFLHFFAFALGSRANASVVIPA